ncbi:GNAT family N-acetyltransferase [Paracoccus sp. (in: a-proteobacteria)]|uniref:GNAT family N-acetyltransferase n=1 Tax=Paracoccus sp. TaxID=267 RepID=UPI0026DF2C01|nr:GNAT family N-acetyltransferase [Paracoccus sp. (in: a-proteobacteria)]MDO5369712.1 GNAT family N-acetyltransferase [Paracoccus sp. (in: a-proteobacteria)]
MTPRELAELHARCFVTPRPWNEAEFAALLSSAACVLHETAGGFLLGRIAGGEAELLTLAVDPAARRAGRGRDLVRRFQAACAAAGAEAAFLEVASDNAPALALYRACGWSPAGLRRNYYAPGIDAVVMRHPLSG